MVKRDMKKALGASLKAEEQAVRDRFENAKTVSPENVPAPREQPEQEAAVRVVSDRYDIPDGENELLSRIRTRCMKAGVSTNKYEVLRVALVALDALPDRELKRLFDNSRIQTGNPKREILTFTINRADIIKFRRRFLSKPSPSTRKVLIGRRIATIYGDRI